MKRIRNGQLPVLPSLVGILLLVAVSAVAQEEVITLGMEEHGDTQRPPVAFQHDLHMGLFNCLDCHHSFEGDENVLEEEELWEGNEDILCSACHGPGDNPDLQQAYHYQCIGCHMQVRKSGGDSGPELCGACHIAQ